MRSVRAVVLNPDLMGAMILKFSKSSANAGSKEGKRRWDEKENKKENKKEMLHVRQAGVLP